MSTQRHDPLRLQFEVYVLATAEIVYRMPDRPELLQTFIWQHYDLAPDYPELRKFLDFWVRNIDGQLHSVTVGRTELLTPPRYTRCTGLLHLH